MKNIFKVLAIICKHSKDFWMQMYNNYLLRFDHSKFGNIGKNVRLDAPIYWRNTDNIFLEDNTHISRNSEFIIGNGKDGKFIMKANSGAAPGLVVITNGHSVKPPLEMSRYESAVKEIGDINKSIIVEEEVWIGANVILLPGVTVGRGAIIGAGSIVTKSIPPYAIATGNPCKFRRFKYNLEEILEHEKFVFPPEKRITKENLEEIITSYNPC